MSKTVFKDKQIYKEDIDKMLVWARTLTPGELFLALEIDESKDVAGQVIGNAITWGHVLFGLGKYFQVDANLAFNESEDTHELDNIYEHYMRARRITSRVDLSCNTQDLEECTEYSMRLGIVRVIAELLGKQEDYEDALKKLKWLEFFIDIYIAKVELAFNRGLTFDVETIRALPLRRPEGGLSDGKVTELFGA